MKAFPALLLMALAAPCGSGEVVYSVCQLLRNPAEYAGRPIRVRGMLLTAPHEGTAIADPQCTESPDLHDQIWEPAIYFASAEAGKPTYDPTALMELVTHARAEGKVVEATFEGVLKNCPVEHSLPNRHYFDWWGCGSPGWYPLELAVRRVTDPTTEPNPFPEIRMLLPPKDAALALWSNTRDALLSPDAFEFFVNNCKGALFPYFAGRLISVSSTPRGTTLLLAIARSAAPDAVLLLDGPLPQEIPPGSIVTFGGVAESYRADPFQMTFSVERSNIRVWTGR
jgi:hypothetical protein